MAEATTAVEKRGPGSCWGLDGLYYRAHAEREEPLSGSGFRLIFYLYAALRQVLYPRHPEVYVAADQFIYYRPHDPRTNVAPDVWVCFGVPKEPERACFRTCEEGATPGFVVEVSSKDSRPGDRGPKFALYQDTLRCQEYLIYDEDRDELLLYRREGDRFQPVAAGPDGRLHSRELGVSFAREPGIMVRVFDAAGEPVATVEESFESAAMLERIRLRLEQEAEEERRRANEAEERAAALAAENARLMEELARLRAEHGGEEIP